MIGFGRLVAGAAVASECSSRTIPAHLAQSRLGLSWLGTRPTQQRRSASRCCRVVAGCSKVDQKGVLQQVQAQQDRLRDIAQQLGSSSGQAEPPVARQSLAQVVAELNTVSQQLLSAVERQKDQSSTSESSCSSEDEEMDEAKAEAMRRKMEAKMAEKAAKKAAKMEKKALKKQRKLAALTQDLALIEDPQLLPEPQLKCQRGGLLVNTLTGQVELEMPSDMLAPQPRPVQLSVCQGKDCRKGGAEALLEQTALALSDTDISVTGCKCLGECKRGPNARLRVPGQGKPTIFTGVQAGELERIASVHRAKQPSLTQ